MEEPRYHIVRLECSNGQEVYSAYPSRDAGTWLEETLRTSRRLLSYDIVLEDLTTREMIECMLLANRDRGITPEYLKAAFLVVRGLDGEVLDEGEVRSDRQLSMSFPAM